MPSRLSPSELSRLTGVSTDTLRHYERKRVLPPPARLPNGYRRYPAEAVATVQMVKRALRIGFSLDELARVLADRQRGGAPCREVRTMVAGRLDDLENRLGELTTLRSELQALLKDWDRRLARLPHGSQARLLESLAESPATVAKARRSPWSRSIPTPRRLRVR